MKKIDVIVSVLLLVGGLNWGLVGIAGFDLVAAIFGEATALSRFVYSLVGFSALYQAMQWKSMQRRWLAPSRA